MDTPLVPERLVDTVEKIEVWVEHRDDEPSTLSISVTGTVESTHWTAPVLEYIDSQEEPPKGVHPYDLYEFAFLATPPQVGDFYSMLPTPIKTVFKWPAFSDNMKVIRVRTAQNMEQLRVDLGGQGTSFEEVPTDTPTEAAQEAETEQPAQEKERLQINIESIPDPIIEKISDDNIEL